MKARQPLSIALVVLAQLLGVESSQSATFDLQAYIFCPPGPEVCEFPSEQALRDEFMQNVEEMNLEFRATGIVFRPLEPIIQQESRFSTITGPSSVNLRAGNGELNATLQAELIATYAEPNPDRVTIFLLPNLAKCWNGVPCPSDTDGFGEEDVLFCYPPRAGLGRTYSHEMGHNFCLRHPHTAADPTSASEQVDHDGDDNINPACAELTNVPDTPADPRIEENSDGAEHTEWCEEEAFTTVDAGSPRSSFCGVECFRVIDGTPQTTGFFPDTENAMSYYDDQACRAPFVINGNRIEAFTPGQIAQVQECLTAIPDRSQLVDVCAASGDSDLDGICNPDDLCPSSFDTAQIDSDGDGLGDACDLCPYDFDPANIDTDLDGVGDACDLDDDNDGCADWVDQNPLDSHIQVGTIEYLNCPRDGRPWYVFEGNDTDGDGLLDCADFDDDNDGIPDEPTGGQAGDDCRIGAICTRFETCPLVPVFTTCQFGTCEELQILVTLINPVPLVSERIFYDDVIVANNTVWIAPRPGQAASEVAAQIAGAPSAIRSTRGRPLEIRVALIEADGTATPISTHTPGDPDIDLSNQGFMVALTPPERNAALSLRLGWTVGETGASPAADTDQDGWPDYRDNCTRVANHRQRDHDRDGVGDRCDPDFDNNGKVEPDDLARLAACHGIDLTIDYIAPDDGPDASVPEVPNDYAASVRQGLCSAMDLNGDRRVDRQDSDIALAYRGRSPGPSAPIGYDALFFDEFEE